MPSAIDASDGPSAPHAPRRAFAAWCLYDFANSAYTTLIVTLVFSVYFREVVVGAADNRGDRLWGLGNFLAMVVTAAVAPVAGALADHSGWRRRLLILSTLICVVATGLLATTRPGGIVWALLLYAVATVGFELGYVFYNAFLPDVASMERSGRASGWAWAVGYLGGLSAVAICMPWITTELRVDGVIVPESADDRRVAFVLTAAFFLLFALPAFVWLRERRAVRGMRVGEGAWIGIGLRRVLVTVRHLRDYRETAKFILASLCFNDGISTIIAFSAIYATTTFGFSSVELTWLFLALNVAAFPGAVAAGYLADRIGARRALAASLVLWIGVILLGATAQDRRGFWLMAIGAALGMGSTQAVARSFMAQLSPPHRVAEFFGFYVLSGKFAAMFGPLLFGLVSAATGNQRLAVLSLLPFFVVGWLIVLTIDEDAARQAAQASAV